MRLSYSRQRSRFLTANSQGPRDEQQDASICLQSTKLGTALIVVCDGVGGKTGGRIASQKTTELAQQLWEERGGQLSNPTEELEALCRTAHEQINEEGRKSGISPRTTIVALYLTLDKGHWVHSGDSRLYHFCGGQLVSRTQDHSVLQLLVERGLVKEEEMGSHPDQGALLQSLGGEEYFSPAVGEASITPDDAFLLCTDGFWERTSVEEMAALLAGTRAETPELAAQAVERAVERNGAKGDNVTVAVALPAREAIHLASLQERSRNLMLGLGGSTLVLILIAAMVWLPMAKKPSTRTAQPVTKANPTQPVAKVPPPPNVELQNPDSPEGPLPSSDATPPSRPNRGKLRDSARRPATPDPKYKSLLTPFRLDEPAPQPNPPPDSSR